MSFREKGITYDMRCAWAEHLIDDIRCISDINFQRQTWIKNSIPNVFYTWEECMCRFFDDQNIDEFLADIDPQFGLSQQQIDELWKLRNIMRKYSDATPQTMDPRDVIADPRWHEVVACAQETLKAFEGYEVPRDDEIEA